LRANKRLLFTAFSLLLFLFTLGVENLHANVAVLLAEPYGGYGKLVPIGHSTVYLDRVCAETPVKLRRCHAGEYGIVLGRYRSIAGRDWFAIPLIPYLYAVEQATEVPESADAKQVAQLRDEYRRRNLQEFTPVTEADTIPGGQWIELIGAAYDRRLFAFEIETTEAQDDELIKKFNSSSNKSHFSFFTRNCAHFVRDVINFYYPKTIRRSIIADLGFTTPKQVAKLTVRFAEKHPELQFSAFIIPQIPGSRPNSRHVRGVAEALVKSKKYLAPMIAINPWLVPGVMTGYISLGRFNPSKYAETVYDPQELQARAEASNPTTVSGTSNAKASAATVPANPHGSGGSQ
jgi:hypothetical protein